MLPFFLSPEWQNYQKENLLYIPNTISSIFINLYGSYSFAFLLSHLKKNSLKQYRVTSKKQIIRRSMLPTSIPCILFSYKSFLPWWSPFKTPRTRPAWLQHVCCIRCTLRLRKETILMWYYLHKWGEPETLVYICLLQFPLCQVDNKLDNRSLHFLWIWLPPFSPESTQWKQRVITVVTFHQRPFLLKEAAT